MKETSLCALVLFLLSSFKAANVDNTFSIIILPDTQYYTLYDGNNGFPNTYKMQTQWIADNASAENIKFAIHMGDMTHRNSLSEWMIADEAHEVLDDAEIPYSVVPGNHDYPGNGSLDSPNSELYNQFFGPSRFSNASWYGGSCSTIKNDNNYCFFSYENFKFLVISLEFAPSKDVLCWADQLISAHPDHNVILATHCYQRSHTEYNTTCNSSYNVVGSSGDDMWNELARRHSNVLLVLSGHVANVAYRVDSGNAGNCVHQILSDYQYEKWQGTRYGNGWMRQLTFNPSLGSVDIESFSALPNVNTLNHTTYSSDPNHSDHKYTIQNVFLTPTHVRKQISDTFNDLYVHTTETGNQLKSEVASSNGDFVVVWEDDSDGNGLHQIYARGFYADGCQKFAPFTVNQAASGQQLKPHVDVSPDGDFVVVWEDDKDGNGSYQILAAGFDENGQRLFSDIVINATASGQQFRPRVAVQESGNFIVVWEDDQDNIGEFKIMATGFNKLGTTKLIQDFTVNQVSTGQQRNPDIALSPNGSYVIVWEDDNDGNDFYQIYSAGFSYVSGNRIFQDQTVNQNFSGQQFNPKVDMDQNGNFTIVWEDDNNLNNIFQILGAHFDFNGQRIGDDFIVKADGSGQLKNPDISKNSDGDYIIIWEDDHDGNELFQIKARGYKSNSSVLFSERTINEDASGDQKRPTIAFNNQLNYMSTWEDDLDENGEWQILANGHDLTTETALVSDCSSTCPSNLVFSGNQNINNIYEAAQVIHSTATINASISYSSGKCITLERGFSAQNNFAAFIEGCN